MHNLYNFTQCKYKKSIEFSQRCIISMVKDLSALLNIQPIKEEQYKTYSPNRKLNHIYFIHDVMDLDTTHNEARWVLFKIIMRGNTVVSLGGYTSIKHAHRGNAALGPLYIDGKLEYAYPTSNQIYDSVYSYITQYILPELDECHIIKNQL